MSNCRKCALFATILLFFSAFTACTSVDDTLGEGFIPDDMVMKLRVDTLGFDAGVSGIEAYLVHTDSFAATNLSYGYFGSMNTENFGVLRTGAVFTYCWGNDDTYNLITDGKYFGYVPTLDSLVIDISIASYKGDTTVVQKYNLYELTERIHQDSVYYADHDLSQSVDWDNPLATFTHSGTDAIRLKLEGPKAEGLMHRLVDTVGGAYDNDSIFFDKFNGLYIAETDDSPSGAVKTIDYAYTEMQLYFHRHDYAMVEDEYMIAYYVAETKNTMNYSPNIEFNIFHSDYTGLPFEHQINDESAPVEAGYIQSLGGVATKIRFTEDFVRELHATVQPPYKSMLVNRAELQLPVNDPTAKVLDNAPVRLGSYAPYSPSFTGIFDYGYLYEQDYGLTLPYGGYLNRSASLYRLNLIFYIQSIINTPLDEAVEMARANKYEFTVAPSVDELYNFSQVELHTAPTAADSSPLKLVLTYTLLKQ